MEILTYKCPNCGGGLVFDPKTQKFKCEYCLSDFTEEELKRLAEIERSGGKTADSAEQPARAASMAVYSCPSCGAELVTDETTAATFCYYCHNPVVLSGRLEGGYHPDRIIPFEVDRKKAEEIFKTWIRGKRYVPNDFYSPKQMELMEGIYYPYWLYSCVVDGYIEGEGLRKKTTVAGSIRYIETSRYAVEKKGIMPVEHVARNALRKADRQLSERVLPYDMKKMRPFAPGYLSGFQAERRDREKEEFRIELEAEVKQFAAESLRNSLSGYDSVNVRAHEENLRETEWSYALLPVWVMTYRDRKKDKLYYFAMNGQSGKICGVLPVDYGKLAGLFAAVFVPVFLLLLLGGYLL